MSISAGIKIEAIALRKAGFSIKEIARKFKLAQSTTSLWLRNVNLSKKGKERFKNHILLAQRKNYLYWKTKREQEDELNKKFAKETLKSVKFDVNHCRLYAAILFWCEGGKVEKTGVRFINSDPLLIKTFLCLFRKGFNVDEKRFHLLIHLHKYHSEKKQKIFWSSIANIPINQFNKSFIKENSGKRIRENYPGCLAIYYNEAKLAREIKAIFKEFAKKIIAGVV